MAEIQIDEGLHSRQLAVYGEASMKRMSSHRVLISGLNGLGAEVAKNVILANFKGVTLHDNINVSFGDLAAHFYLKESDLGVNRAEACASRLQELNPTVQVTTASGELTRELIARHHTVVILDTFTPARGITENKLVEMNEFCRSHVPCINFITADVAGVFSKCFCDFGSGFVVSDVDGEQPLTAIVSGIIEAEHNGQKILHVTCVGENRIEFSDGDLVKFSEVKGLTGLNDSEPLPVTVKSPFSFSVPYPSHITDSEYVNGGIVTQVKQHKKLDFASLADRLSNPGECLESDFSKFGRSSLLHLLFRALYAYRQANVDLPFPGDRDHAKSLHSLAKHINATTMAESCKISEEELNSETTAKVVEAFSSTCRGVINPMCAILGGIVGQEITKAASGKFHPLFQHFYMDFIEALPSVLPTSEELSASGSRYDSQVSVFGKQVQDKLNNLRIFVVGAGALGCEFLKNFAMLGIATGERGHVVLTDDDTIERSNLSRQFLFRNWHVGESKSQTAATIIKQMNPEINIVAMQDRVAPNTENVFNKIWLDLDLVCNALDNVKARLYVDQRCVFFGKPLLESGTLGTKCNTQIVLPHKTENYGASADPPEKEAPDCVLHNFPHNINHCLSWARSEFIGNFESTPAEMRSCLLAGSPEAYANNLRTQAGSVPQEVVQKLQSVYDAIIEAPTNFEDCIGWARRRFEDLFSNRIRQLIFAFPQDAKTSTGTPFWSPPKRFPTPAVFDDRDPLHIQFIIAAANLRAKTFSIPVPENNRDENLFRSVLKNVIVPDFVPKSEMKIETNPEAESRGGIAMETDDSTDELSRLVDQLKTVPVNISLDSIVVEEFEKDNDLNYHMDFISAVGNLRGRCYDINEISKFQAKLIAGRIIPAIATTTAMATGFVCMELFKLIQDKPVEQFRNTFANLALPLFAMSEPLPPKKNKSRKVKNIPDPINHPEYEEEEVIVAYPEGFTVWDKLELRHTAKMTLAQVIRQFEDQHKITIDAVGVKSPDGKGLTVFNPLMQHTKANLSLTINEIVVKYVGVDPSSIQYFLPVISFVNDDGDTVETPEVIFWL